MVIPSSRRRAPEAPASVDGQLRLGAGFAAEERPDLVRQLGRLDERLKGLPASAVDMEISVKERELPSQRVVLECRIARRPRLVATSTEPRLERALTEVRQDLLRLLNDAKTRQEPRNNRRLRRS